jgi:signal transduction histidine kinase
LTRISSSGWAGHALIAGLAIAGEIELWTSRLASKPLLAPVWLAWTLPLLLRRRYPLAIPLVPTAVLAGASFFIADVLHTMGTPVAIALVSSFALGRWNDRPGALAGLAIAYACLQIEVANFGGGAADVGVASVTAVAPWLTGQALRSREAQASQLLERAVQLEREREQRARAARAAERLRIARELHDVIAHSIGVMTIQATAAHVLLDSEPSRAAEPLGLVSEIGRQTLGEMRRLLGAIQPESDNAKVAPQPSLASLSSLAEHYRGAGLPVDVDVDGTPRALGVGLELAAYRIVQEALTNSLKYAGPATARVLVRYTPDGVDLEIADDGDGSGPGSGSGHGLVGMRERAAIYGGRLEAGPGPDGGFAVHARLPLERSSA